MTPVVAKSPRSPSSIRISTVAGGVVRIAGSGSVVVRPSNNVAEGKATLVIEGYSTVKFIGFRISEEPLKIEGEDPVAVFDVFKCGKNVFAIRQY